jgi:hypothetical protein
MSKPFFFGSNAAKRVAKKADARDRKIVLAKFGPSAAFLLRRVPKAALHHQELVRQRHAAYDPAQGAT